VHRRPLAEAERRGVAASASVEADDDLRSRARRHRITADGAFGRYYDEARELARLVTAWSQEIPSPALRSESKTATPSFAHSQASEQAR
jgi:hypothetical protein